MGMRVLVAIAFAWALAMGARVQAENPTDTQSSTGQKADSPNASPPLLVQPTGSAPAAEPAAQEPGVPPPRALDSKRTPMPDRLSDDHWLQYFPEAPPTPYIPNSGGTSGGGAAAVKKIFTGGAPVDLPGASVTRTPEDQLAPPSAPATRTP